MTEEISLQDRISLIIFEHYEDQIILNIDDHISIQIFMQLVEKQEKSDQTFGTPTFIDIIIKAERSGRRFRSSCVGAEWKQLSCCEIVLNPE